MVCKHFTPDHSTDLDGWGKCAQIESYKARGATPSMIESVISEKLNGGQICAGKYIFEAACCNTEKGCEKYEEFKNE